MATKTVYDPDLDLWRDIDYTPGSVYYPRFDTWIDPFAGVGDGTPGGPYAEPYGDSSQRPSNPSIGQQYFDTDYYQLLAWNGSEWETIGPFAAVPPTVTRLTLTVTSPSLAPGASHLFTLETGYRTFVLTNVSLSAPGRAQGYRSSAVRAADEGRAFGAAPIPDGLELDALLIAGALSQAGAGLIALEPDGLLYGRLTNTGSSAAVLALELGILPLEEAQQL